MTQAQARNSWLFNPAADLLLGCGLLYALVFVGVTVSGDAFLKLRPVFLLPLGVLLLSGPHYGATLVRVYEQREDRRGYFRVSVGATAVLLALYVAAVYSPLLSAYLLTLYLTWSPWHYTAQNYGLSVMFLRRNQVALPTYAKRLLRSTFILSFVITFVAMHGGEGLAWDPRAAGDGRVAFLSLGIPPAFGRPLVLGLLAANLLAIGAAAVVFLRLGAARQLLPSAALVLSQALWFTAPFAVQFLGVETGMRPIDRQQRVEDYVLLVAMAHAIQYLWVTAYYAKKSPGWHGKTRFYAKAFLAGSAAWTLPLVLVGPDRFGGMAYDGGLSLLLAAVVNLHHFILDGEIWKLRQQRVASVLIQDGARVGADAIGPAGAGWTRRLVWGTCGLGGLIAVGAFVSLHFTYPAAEQRRDLDAQRRTLDRLAWAGQDVAALRFKLARSAARAGEDQLALASFERGLSLKPDWKGYQGLADLHRRRGELEAADATYAEAEERLGARREILLTRSVMWFHEGDVERSIALIERAIELDPQDVEARLILSGIHEGRGDERAALEQARAAWDARPGATQTTQRLAWLLATCRDPALRDPAEAERVIQAAISSPDEAPPELVDVLAVSYAAQGRFPEAVELGTQAAARADASGNAGLAGQIRSRVALFEDERPYLPQSPAPSG